MIFQINRSKILQFFIIIILMTNRSSVHQMNERTGGLAITERMVTAPSFSRNYNMDPQWWSRKNCLSNMWTGLAPNQCEEPVLSQCENRHAGSFDTDKRIIACGDIHGDFTLLKKILLINNLIIYTDDTWKWIGFDAILVLCGDLVDMHRPDGKTYTGPDNQEVDFSEWKIFMLLSELYNQGGDIIRLYGNHELFLRRGVTKYRTEKSKRDDSSRHAQFTELWSSPDGIYNKLMSNCGGGKAIVRINNWIFCHGGIDPIYVHKFIEKYNGLLIPDNKKGDWFIRNYNEHLHEYMVNMNQDDTEWMNPVGILWSRKHADEKASESDCAGLVDLMSQIFEGIDNVRVCQAHCVQPADGLISTPNKIMYNMTNIVSQEMEQELGVNVIKLTLPAVKCDRSQTFGRRRGNRQKPTCFNLPSINFSCVPDASGYSIHEQTGTLGRIWRIDCSMSKGLQYHRNSLKKILRANGPYSELEIEYMYRMYDLAVSPQNLEIHNSQAPNQETVFHVIGSNTPPFETIEEFHQNNPQLDPARIIM
tara:strand:- start:948 stop:2549 length:1602 start_codon:yes stop_codon:yes gene_type:complete